MWGYLQPTPQEDVCLAASFQAKRMPPQSVAEGCRGKSSSSGCVCTTTLQPLAMPPTRTAGSGEQQEEQGHPGVRARCDAWVDRQRGWRGGEGQGACGGDEPLKEPPLGLVQEVREGGGRGRHDRLHHPGLHASWRTTRLMPEGEGECGCGPVAGQALAPGHRQRGCGSLAPHAPQTGDAWAPGHPSVLVQCTCPTAQTTLPTWRRFSAPPGSACAPDLLAPSWSCACSATLRTDYAAVRERRGGHGRGPGDPVWVRGRHQGLQGAEGGVPQGAGQEGGLGCQVKEHVQRAGQGMQATGVAVHGHASSHAERAASLCPLPMSCTPPHPTLHTMSATHTCVCIRPS